MKTVSDILRNIPCGANIRLYSPMFGECKFVRIKEGCDEIVVLHGEKFGTEDDFFADGKYYKTGECLLFPSKGHKSWENWQDVLFPQTAAAVVRDKFGGLYSIVARDGGVSVLDSAGHTVKSDTIYDMEYATVDEAEEFYRKVALNCGVKKEVLRSINCKPFTYSDFKPFDKVVCRRKCDAHRTYDSDVWRIDFFSKYYGGWSVPYQCMMDKYDQCVPYNEETEKLIGTRDDYDGCYKTWR